MRQMLSKDEEDLCRNVMFSIKPIISSIKNFNVMIDKNFKTYGLNTNPLSVGITTSQTSFTNVFKFTNITQLPSCLATFKV